VSTLSTEERAELEALRARVAALEEERATEIARLSAALGNAQERVYWLDRWRIDLNALMRKRGAAEFRAALRAARAVVRAVKSAGRIFGR
jgi:hypothetical protein